jgi:polar amino acid transport system substrate-binding protein
MKFAYLIEPPFNDRTEQGDVIGCDVELARTVLAMIGVEDVEFVETEFSRLLPGLEEGLWTMTTGLFDTAERRKTASFSRPIWALPDGLLVKKGNPANLTGYAALAQKTGCKVAAIKDQLQHRAALEAGVPQDRITLFDTYEAAAKAVLDGDVDAYVSVAMAHRGFLAQYPHSPADIVTVSAQERPAAFGAFGFKRSDDALRQTVNNALQTYLGSDDHRAMMHRYGFADSDIDLIATEASSKKV